VVHIDGIVNVHGNDAALSRQIIGAIF